MVVIIAVLALIVLVVSLKLFFEHIGTRALLYFMAKKEYTLPSDEDLKECSEYVIRRMFKLSHTGL